MTWPQWIRERVFDNLSYKLVALFVTLILWVTMLGRKEIVTEFDLPIQFLTSSTQVLFGEPSNQWGRVKLIGVRSSVRQFHRRDEALIVDLSRLGYGDHRVRLTKEALDLPLGLRLISIDPEEIDVRLEARLDGE